MEYLKQRLPKKPLNHKVHLDCVRHHKTSTESLLVLPHDNHLEIKDVKHGLPSALPKFLFQTDVLLFGKIPLEIFLLQRISHDNLPSMVKNQRLPLLHLPRQLLLITLCRPCAQLQTHRTALPIFRFRRLSPCRP